MKEDILRVTEGLLREDELLEGVEEVGVHGKEAVLEKVVGLAGAVGGVELVEAFYLGLDGVELGDSVLHVLNVAGAGTEIEAARLIDELVEGLGSFADTFLPHLAVSGRRGGVGTEEHVGFEGADAGGHVVTHIAGASDRGKPLIADGCGELVGLVDAQVRNRGADEHGEDEDASADAEFGFEFHGVLVRWMRPGFKISEGVRSRR